MIDTNVVTGVVTMQANDMWGIIAVFVMLGIFIGLIFASILFNDIKKKCFIYFNRDKKMTIEEGNKAYHDFKYDISKFRSKGE
jgi:hypothetical protein